MGPTLHAQEADVPLYDPDIVNNTYNNMNPVAHIRIGVATTPAILLGASADVPIVWTSPFPDANYLMDFQAGTGLIGRGTVALKAGSKTTTGIVVTVTAGLAVSLGSEIVAVATCS